jgi:nitrogen fixation NifU-like protein
MSLSNLYKSVILEHNKNPYHFHKMEDANLILEAYNQICGDQFKIFIKQKEGVISDISFHGYGCAISKASTSILVQSLEGQNLAKAKKITSHFLELVNGENTEEAMYEDFLAFQAAKDFPSRMKCATLSWEEVEKVMSDE